MQKPLISIAQILVLRNEGLARELSAAVWAAFKEVEAFYNADEPRAVFRRVNLSVDVPDSIQKEGALDITWDWPTSTSRSSG